MCLKRFPKLGKKTGGVKNQKKNRDHPRYRIFDTE